MWNRVGRVVVAVCVVALLAVPAEARPPADSDGWVPKLVKLLKKFAIGTHGDGVIVPRP